MGVYSFTYILHNHQGRFCEEGCDKNDADIGTVSEEKSYRKEKKKKKEDFIVIPKYATVEMKPDPVTHSKSYRHPPASGANYYTVHSMFLKVFTP